MRKITHTLGVSGVALAAVLTMSAGPASAGAVSIGSGIPSSADREDEDQITGYYKTLRSCEMAGAYGERADAWRNHKCSEETSGLRQGTFRLTVNVSDHRCDRDHAWDRDRDQHWDRDPDQRWDRDRDHRWDRDRDQGRDRDRDHAWDRDPDQGWDRDRTGDRDRRCDRNDDRPDWHPLDGGLHGDPTTPGDDVVYIDNGDDLSGAHSGDYTPRRK